MARRSQVGARDLQSVERSCQYTKGSNQVRDRHTATPWCCERHESILLQSYNLAEVRVAELLYRARCFRCLLDLCATTLRDILLQLFKTTSTGIIFWQAVRSIKPLECWETSNAVLCAKLLVGIAIDFADRDLLTGGSEGVGEFFPGGCELLAVTAPWGEELDHTRLSTEHDAVEVVWSEVEDIGCGGQRREGESDEGSREHDDCFDVYVVVVVEVLVNKRVSFRGPVKDKWRGNTFHPFRACLAYSSTTTVYTARHRAFMDIIIQ